MWDDTGDHVWSTPSTLIGRTSDADGRALVLQRPFEGFRVARFTPVSPISHHLVLMRNALGGPLNVSYMIMCWPCHRTAVFFFLTACIKLLTELSTKINVNHNVPRVRYPSTSSQTSMSHGTLRSLLQCGGDFKDGIKTVEADVLGGKTHPAQRRQLPLVQEQAQPDTDLAKHLILSVGRSRPEWPPRCVTHMFRSRRKGARRKWRSSHILFYGSWAPQLHSLSKLARTRHHPMRAGEWLQHVITRATSCA